jgi:hypothetical protein
LEKAEKPSAIPLIFAGPKGNTISKIEKENIYRKKHADMREKSSEIPA